MSDYQDQSSDPRIQDAIKFLRLVGEADSMTFTEIGMDPNSLANRGFGLYSKNGVAKLNYFDNIFGNHTSSRSNVYVVKEQYSHRVVLEHEPTGKTIKLTIGHLNPQGFDEYRPL